MCKPCPAWSRQFGPYILALCEQYYTHGWFAYHTYHHCFYDCRSSTSSATRLCWSSWTLLSCTLTSNRSKLYPQTEQVTVFIPLRIIWTIYIYIILYILKSCYRIFLLPYIFVQTKELRFWCIVLWLMYFATHCLLELCIPLMTWIKRHWEDSSLTREGSYCQVAVLLNKDTAGVIYEPAWGFTVRELKRKSCRNYWQNFNSCVMYMYLIINTH